MFRLCLNWIVFLGGAMNYFEENNKLLSLQGVIGRRNFIIICLIVLLIENLIYNTPLLYTLLKNPTLINVFKVSTPFWLSVLILATGIIAGALMFGAVVRRIRDIIGERNDNKIFLIASIFLVIKIISATPAGIRYSFGFLDIFITTCLIFFKGKITSSKPKSDLIKFNWGAFWGTWIWGLWNKVYIALLVLPLLFTAGGWFIFMLICGMKGNEWAYPKKTESLENFHNSQSIQAILFAFLAPVITVLCGGIIILSSGKLFQKYMEQNPKTKYEMIQKLTSYQTKATETNFEKIEIKEDEYLFYINPQAWISMSDNVKRMFFNNAFNYTLIKSKKYDLSPDMLSKNLDTAHKIKILSSYNNEVLAYFELSQQPDKTQQIKQIWNSGIKLNKKPATP